MHWQSLSRRTRRYGVATLVTLVLLAGVSATLSSTSWKHARLRRAVLAERFTSARFFGQTAWSPCTVDDRAIVVTTHCPTPQPGSARLSDLARIATEASAWLSSDESPAALHTRALLDAPWGTNYPKRLDRAVAALEQARTANATDAAILNDLAVEHLAVAERDQQLEPMLRALDAIERSVTLDSTSTSSLFNRALILERLYLNASAERAWNRFLELERDTNWTNEARSHLARLHAKAPALWGSASVDSLLALDSTTRYREIGARVARARQSARDRGLTVLEQWGRAVESGDDVRAGKLLGLASAIGDHLKALGGDETVALSVAAIRKLAPQRSNLHDAAAAQGKLTKGVREAMGNLYDSSLTTLTAAETVLQRVNQPMARWARFYHASSLINHGKSVDAERLLQSILDESTPNEHVLTGRALAMLGVNQVRQAHYERAIEWYRRAATAFAGAQEEESDGYAARLLGIALRLAGQSTDGRAEAFRAQRLLAPYRRSIFLNQNIEGIATDASELGLPFAALALGDEVMELTRGTARPEGFALTLAARARDLLVVGRTAEAERAVAEAQKWADSIPGDRGMDGVRASILLSRGEILRKRDPRAALPLLDSAAKAFRNNKSDLFLPKALHAAAEAASESGDRVAARRSLDEATRALERQTSQFTRANERAAYSETAERVFDSLIEAEMDAAKTSDAFAAIERNRLAVWSPRQLTGAGQLDSADRVALDTIAARMADSALLVEYALLRDRVVIWTASRRGGAHAVTVRVSRDTIAALADQMTLELDEDRPHAQSASARLYDFLVRPLGRELDGIGRITFVPDRELFGVPFVALWDRDSTHYLLEKYDVRTSPSAVFYAQASQAAVVRSAPRKDNVLVIGDPGGANNSESRRFAPLPWATVEADSVARLHSASPLIGRAANRTEVMRLLQDASVFHFAGHAVFDANQPERSFLALADSGGKSDMLTASEIAALRPSNLRLVVLSACSTLNPRPTRNGAVGGLAFTFLQVGARAIVSSLWEVHDDATAALFVDFHRRLASHATPSEALRGAQLAALRSSRPSLRVARTWAAFTYTGS